MIAISYAGFLDSEGLHFGISSRTVQTHLDSLMTPGGEAVFEDISGDLYHYPQSSGRTDRSFLVGFDGSVDIDIESTFVNPYAHSEHEWSHGLAVRIDPDRLDSDDLPHLAFVIHSRKIWEVYRVSNDAPHFTLLANGAAGSIKTGDAERNHLKVSAIGAAVRFYINNVQVGGNIDLTGATHAGDISAFEGFFVDTEQTGAVTRFENLRGRIVE